MRSTRTTLIAGSALGVMAMVGLAMPAAAADSTVQAELKPVAGNGVEGSGSAMVEVTGNTLTVTMAATGLLPDNPHAAHIHFGAEARHECPNAGDDADGNGTVNTTEGGPAYGPIVVSLTKTGDTSAASGLAIDRFDTAPRGNLQYERGSIQVTDEVGAAISAGKSVVVIHGVDHNHDGKYSGDTKSDLDPSLPTEATDPALCGALWPSQMSGMPSGGVQTGAGSTSGTENLGLITIGGGALLAGAGAFVIGRRKVGEN